jgi:retinol dehydrogenase 12
MKTVLVTGANRGLGRATAEKLARRGCAVILTARDAAKGAAAADEIRAAVPNAKVEALELDVASLASIRSFGAAFEARGAALDVLLNNAGVMQQSPTRRLTKEGFEETFATNTLGPFLLTKLLLPSLERAPSARVVNVSSRMHAPGTRGAEVRFDFDDPNLEKNYDPDRAYKNSKLAVLWFTYALARKLPPRKITANAVCPGFVPATAAASTTGFMNFIMRTVMPLMPFASSVDKGTETFVFAALAPELEGATARFFGESKELASSDESHDRAKQDRFWELACRAVDIVDWP